MDKFTKLEGVAAPLKMVNIDTDMIIPKNYLKTVKRTGLGKGLFAEKRYNEDGSENPDFVLNKPAYRNAKIIVADDNFGCGSSREHAPWALLDYGIRCVISTSFGDIFYNNCFKNGILPIKVSPEDLEKLFDDAERGANATLSIDLESAGNPRTGRRQGEVRDRSVPQALPAQRPRRRRPDDGQEGQDRGLRREGRRRAAVDVSSYALSAHARASGSSSSFIAWISGSPLSRGRADSRRHFTPRNRLRNRDRAARHLGMHALDHAAVDLHHALALVLRQVERRDHLARLRDFVRRPARTPRCTARSGSGWISVLPSKPRSRACAHSCAKPSVLEMSL